MSSVSVWGEDETKKSLRAKVYKGIFFGKESLKSTCSYIELFLDNYTRDKTINYRHGVRTRQQTDGECSHYIGSPKCTSIN